jgi:NAD(P)H-hydrate epimerase
MSTNPEQSVPPLTRDQVREADRRAIQEYGIPGVVLMENAARGAVQHLASLGITGTVSIVVGNGNNGGDGLVMARHLDAAGYAVRVLLCCDANRFTPDAATNFVPVVRAGVPTIEAASLTAAGLARELATADWIVDSLLGTGLQAEVRRPRLDYIEAINASGRRVFSVDVPSGMDCDTGQPLGACVRALHTATFLAPKVGFANPSARDWLGTVHVVPIGVPRRLLETLAFTK